mmetsp:Transcript_15630/g.49078  ORF Transcript_15630/g.49078 Transcript_15630/m.49078 type:complete len:244 (-) Transcript_15630:689-1420(-)
MASQVLSLSVGALAQGASRRPSRAASRARDCAMPSLTNEGRRVVANATTLETKGFMGRSLCAIAPYSGAGRICARALKSFAVVASGADDLPSLNALPLAPVINTEGLILPKFKRGCKATIFAILDDKKKVQYIGFSKDIRGTLRTMMGRQPKLCYFYKSVDFMEVDQKRMLAIRSAVRGALSQSFPSRFPTALGVQGSGSRIWDPCLQGTSPSAPSTGSSPLMPAPPRTAVRSRRRSTSSSTL